MISLDLVEGTAGDDGGVAHGLMLVRICDAMAGGSVEEMHGVRADAFAAMGADAAIDAIAVSALFHLMNRVANATGTPLDPSMIKPAEKIGEKIGANSFLSRADTPGLDRDGLDRDGVGRDGT